MRTVQETLELMSELRERYDAVVARRIDSLTETGYFLTAKPDACDNPDYEMEALEDWLEELRQELATLKPEEYHYGKVLKSAHALVKGTKYSTFGDNGYYICRECKGVFKCGAYTEEKKRGCETEALKSCEEHFGGVKEYTMVLKEEELPV